MSEAPIIAGHVLKQSADDEQAAMRQGVRHLLAEECKAAQLARASQNNIEMLRFGGGAATVFLMLLWASASYGAPEILVSGYVVTPARWDPFLTPIAKSMFIGTVIALIVTLVACSYHPTWRPVDPAFIHSLTRLGDLRVIGPLTEALSAEDPGVRAAAADGLYLLLPRMRPKDAHLLTGSDRRRLHNVLARADRRDGALMVAILRVVQVIEDTEAVPYVAGLVSMGTALRDGRVREAAWQCLTHFRPELKSGAKAAQMRTLLRSSEAPNDALLRSVEPSADPLLRPAANSVADPQTLLRTPD